MVLSHIDYHQNNIYMQYMRLLSSMVLLCAVLFGCNKKNADLAQNKATPPSIKWMSITEAEAAAKKQPRKIIVDAYTDWCGWCKRMDASTFQHPVVIDYINKNYYAVKLNAESREPIVFRGKTYAFEGRANALAVELLGGQMSYPTIVFLDEKQQLIQAVPGFQDAPKFDLIMNYFGQDKHQKKVSFADFAASFQSTAQ